MTNASFRATPEARAAAETYPHKLMSGKSGWTQGVHSNGPAPA